MDCRTFLKRNQEIPKANIKERKTWPDSSSLPFPDVPSSKLHGTDMVLTQEANQASLLQALVLFYTEYTPIIISVNRNKLKCGLANESSSFIKLVPDIRNIKILTLTV